MERILRSEKMAEIILLPIRHHSPACSVHIRQMITALQPSVILVEGPENANPLIPVMVHADTKAPFAIYYSYNDAAGMISENKEQYKCYYPFLDYSPELVAIRTAAQMGITVEFIDLPYGDILAASEAGKGLLKEEEKNNYNDDYLLSRNTYVKQLCEKTGLRSFDEFWEKYFELNGLKRDCTQWFEDLLTYCALVRENTPEHVLQEEGCLARERHMAGLIQGWAKKLGSDGKVLVVTGGFHTPGLKDLLGSTVASEKKAIPLSDQGVYLMSYSMEAADALNGYASGMPYPGFYQSIWEKIDSSDTPYKDGILNALVACGKEVRRKEGNLSTYDEICACSMAEGLAALRDKKEPGAYELIDAVLSCFVKGEYNLATDVPMRILRRKMTGNQVGQLCEHADVPPILKDFEEQCKKSGLKNHSTLETELTLSIFSSKKHRQTSMLFNRMLFLGTAYARKIKGPNLQMQKDKNRMREIWKYKWTAQVVAALIDSSVYGATIEEACTGIVRRELKKDMGAKESALLLTRVFEMGLTEQMMPVYDRVKELLLLDTSFFSLAEALKLLMMMSELSVLYMVELQFDDLVYMACHKLITLLPTMTMVKDEDVGNCLNALKLLYQVTGRKGALEGERETFYDVLTKMKEDSQIHAGLNGCIHGILYGCQKETAAQVSYACEGYLTGTREQMMKTAAFFKGLFFTARDLVFIGESFLVMLDSFLGQVTEGEFMELLPELRLAFSYFTPREIDKIAAGAASIHGKSAKDIMEARDVLPEWYSYGKALDGYVKGRMEEGRHGG